MRVLRSWETSVLFLGLTACGGGSASAPIALLDDIGPPTCFTGPSNRFASATTVAEQVVAAAQSEQDFEMSFYTQEAALLLTPVRSDPTASSWRRVSPAIEMQGSVLARGDGWAVLQMVITASGRVLEATIQTFPGRMIFDFGAHELEARPNLLRLDTNLVGCDPSQHVSFEVGPAWSDGKLQLDAHTCWWNGEPTPTLISTASSTIAQEFQDAYELQCTQVIEHALAD
jgi:hypothetical protein